MNLKLEVLTRPWLTTTDNDRTKPSVWLIMLFPRINSWPHDVTWGGIHPHLAIHFRSDSGRSLPSGAIRAEMYTPTLPHDFLNKIVFPFKNIKAQYLIVKSNFHYLIWTDF